MSSDRATPEIDVRVLGSVSVRLDGAEVNLGGRTQRALFASLVAAFPYERTLSGLIEDLWPDSPPRTARNSVQAYVSRLRGLLGTTVIARTTEGYRLKLDSGAIDRERFLELKDAAESASLSDPARAQELMHSAVTLFRGAPYGELGHESFLRSEVAGLQLRRSEAVQQWFELRLQGTNGWSTLAADLEAAIAEDPLHETLWRQLMRALYRDERHAEALRAFQRARGLLRDELGIEPGAELRELEQRILLQHPEAASSVEDGERHGSLAGSTNIRSTSTSLVGRGELLEELHTLGETCRLVTLTGPGGVGKTRLAIEAGWQSVESGRATALWEVDLLVVTSLADALRNFAVQLGLRDASSSDMIGHIGGALGDDPVTILLDNCEHLVEQVRSALPSLLDSWPHARFIATSRIELRSPSEHILAVPPLSLDSSLSGESTLGGGTAAQLFALRVRRHLPGFRITASTASTVESIVAASGGLPLGIEIAAAQTPLLSLAQIDEQLHQPDSQAHQFAAPADDPRHETIGAMIGWSIELLETVDRELFLSLGAFAASFTLDAARAVAQSNSPQVEHGLQRLVEASMLEALDDGSGRYRLLASFRTFARQHALQSDTTHALALRHAGWIEGLVATATPHQHDAHQIEILETLRSERAEIRDAARYLEHVAPDRFASLVRDLWYWWYLDGRLAECAELLSFATLESDPDLVAARALVKADLGNADGARIEAKLVRALDQYGPDTTLESAMAHVLAGDALTACGRFDACEAPLLEAERQFNELQLPWGAGWAMLRRVRLEGMSRGNEAEAQALTDRARATLEAAGDLSLVAYSDLVLCSVSRLKGQWSRCFELALSVRDRLDALGLAQWSTLALFHAAQSAVHLGFADRATTLRHALSDYAVRRQSKNDAAKAAGLEGEWHLHHGDGQAAVRIYEQLAQDPATMAIAPEAAQVLTNLADAYLRVGDLAAAATALERCAPIWNAFRQPYFRAQYDAVGADLATLTGDDARAAGERDRLATLEVRGPYHVLARVNEGLAVTHSNADDLEAAATALAFADELRAATGSPGGAYLHERTQAVRVKIAALDDAVIAPIWQAADRRAAAATH